MIDLAWQFVKLHYLKYKNMKYWNTGLTRAELNKETKTEMK